MVYKPFARWDAVVFVPPMKTPTAYAAFVGLDWADRSHQVCLRAAESERDEQSVLPH
jgi:hypothetical protein